VRVEIELRPSGVLDADDDDAVKSVMAELFGTGPSG
jgi:hypothetical protein